MDMKEKLGGNFGNNAKEKGSAGKNNYRES
jgi:hypothetical protein